MDNELGILISTEEWYAFDPAKRKAILFWMKDRYGIDLYYLEETEADLSYFYGDENESNNS